jgi:hypothetical protein
MYREEICTKSLVLNPEGEYLKIPTRQWKDNTEKGLKDRTRWRGLDLPGSEKGKW